MARMNGSLAKALALLGSALLFGACGASTTTSSGATASDAQDERSAWTASQLRKLDPDLRDRVRRGDRGRLAVKVFFHVLPSDSELSELMLNRLGEHAVGELYGSDLQRIASRGDVERIEPLSDVGYETH